MRGPTTVNDEFEVGFNQTFESYWYRAEQAGRVIMIVFTAIAMLGLVGRGPFSHATIRSQSGKISVDYEPVARHGVTTTLTVHLRPETTDPIEVWVSQQMIEPMGYQRSIPQADAGRISDGGARLIFSPVAGKPEVVVRLELMPNTVGFVPLQVSDGTNSLHWSMLVLP